jgi:transposase-like protein
LWQSIRITNILERAFREVGRRTRQIGHFFIKAASSDSIMSGVNQMLNKNWSDKIINPISTI